MINTNPLRHINTNPHYSDTSFKVPKTIFCSEPANIEDNVISGLKYDYSDSLMNNHYHRYYRAFYAAEGDDNTAIFHESFIRKFYDNQNIKLVHLIAGVNYSNGYSYLIYGWREN